MVCGDTNQGGYQVFLPALYRAAPAKNLIIAWLILMEAYLNLMGAYLILMGAYLILMEAYLNLIGARMILKAGYWILRIVYFTRQVRPAYADFANCNLLTCLYSGLDTLKTDRRYTFAASATGTMPSGSAKSTLLRLIRALLNAVVLFITD